MSINLSFHHLVFVGLFCSWSKHKKLVTTYSTLHPASQNCLIDMRWMCKVRDNTGNLYSYRELWNVQEAHVCGRIMRLLLVVLGRRKCPVVFELKIPWSIGVRISKIMTLLHTFLCNWRAPLFCDYHHYHHPLHGLVKWFGHSYYFWVGNGIG